MNTLQLQRDPSSGLLGLALAGELVRRGELLDLVLEDGERLRGRVLWSGDLADPPQLAIRVPVAELGDPAVVSLPLPAGAKLERPPS